MNVNTELMTQIKQIRTNTYSQIKKRKIGEKEKCPKVTKPLKYSSINLQTDKNSSTLVFYFIYLQ